MTNDVALPVTDSNNTPYTLRAGSSVRVRPIPGEYQVRVFVGGRVFRADPRDVADCSA